MAEDKPTPPASPSPPGLLLTGFATLVAAGIAAARAEKAKPATKDSATRDETPPADDLQ